MRVRLEVLHGQRGLETLNPKPQTRKTRNLRPGTLYHKLGTLNRAGFRFEGLGFRV